MSDRHVPGGPVATAYHAPPYVVPRAVALPPPPLPQRSPMIGVVALIAAVVACVVAPLVAGLAGYLIGSADIDVVRLVSGPELDLSALSPVRDIVLLGEIAAWAGTATGIWALVQGIVAITTGAGRGQGIAAVVLAAVGPFVFAAATVGGLAFGLAAL